MSYEYSAHEVSEIRIKKMVEDAVKRTGIDIEAAREREAERRRIREALRESREKHTVRVRSVLP